MSTVPSSRYVECLLRAADYALSRPQVTVGGLVTACGVSTPVAHALLKELAEWRIVSSRGASWMRQVIILPRDRKLVRRLITRNCGIPPKPNILTTRTVPAVTPARRRVLPLVAEGMQDAEIAKVLYVSKDTVATHVKRLLADFGARNRAQLVSRAYQFGHLPDPYTPMSGKDGQ